MSTAIIPKKLKVYKGIIHDENGKLCSGVTFTALVDNPATGMMWQTFSEQKQEFKIINKEERLVGGVMMKAGLPIYRRDKFGEYYIVFDAESIQKIAHKFMEDQNSKNVNMMHDPKKKVPYAFAVETFTINKKRGIKAPEGYGNVSEGDWFGLFKINDNKVWEQIKSGEFRGFSVEGEFFQREISEQSENDLKRLDENLKREKFTEIKQRLENLKKNISK
jgi:hypothetical protein